MYDLAVSNIIGIGGRPQNDLALRWCEKAALIGSKKAIAARGSSQIEAAEAPPPGEGLELCSFCERREGKFRCGNCRAMYCSSVCQRCDWPYFHKHVCGSEHDALVVEAKLAIFSKFLPQEQLAMFQMIVDEAKGKHDKSKKKKRKKKKKKKKKKKMALGEAQLVSEKGEKGEKGEEEEDRLGDEGEASPEAAAEGGEEEVELETLVAVAVKKGREEAVEKEEEEEAEKEEEEEVKKKEEEEEEEEEEEAEEAEAIKRKRKNDKGKRADLEVKVAAEAQVAGLVNAFAANDMLGPVQGSGGGGRDGGGGGGQGGGGAGQPENFQNKDSDCMHRPGPAGARAQELHEELLCVVCLESRRGMVFLPCGHTHTCAACDRADVPHVHAAHRAENPGVHLTP